MAELPVAREQVHVRVGEQLTARAVADLDQADVRMPRVRVGHAPVVEAEHVAGQVEHPVDHGLEREVLGDRERVDAVLGRADLRVVVAHVPGPERVVAGLGAQGRAHPLELVLRPRRSTAGMRSS